MILPIISKMSKFKDVFLVIIAKMSYNQQVKNW